MSQAITIETTIHAPIEKVLSYYNEPHHVVKWNSPSEDWHTPNAQNDLRVGGKFVYRMEAKDKSAGFDFSGEYTEIKKHEGIAYVMGDGRKVKALFTHHDNKTTIKITFYPENENSLEMQRAGWQAILNNFKKYVESSNN